MRPMRDITLSLSLLTFFAVQARAETVYEAKFEQPSYQKELALVGQDGWYAFDGVSPQAAKVESENPRLGFQGVRIDGGQLEAWTGLGPEVYLGSYIRDINYHPAAQNKQYLELSGSLNLNDTRTCAVGYSVLGYHAIIGEDFIPFAQIGIFIDEEGGAYPYISNADQLQVNGPPYSLGTWAHFVAQFDFVNRTTRGYINGDFFGEVPFALAMDEVALAVEIFMGRFEQPVPDDVIAFADEFRVKAMEEVTAAPIGHDGSRLGLAASPNPFSKLSRLDFILPAGQSAMLEVFDARGRRILSRDLGHLEAGRQSLDISELGAQHEFESGVYFARVSTEHGLVATTRLIRLH